MSTIKVFQDGVAILLFNFFGLRLAFTATLARSEDASIPNVDGSGGARLYVRHRLPSPLLMVDHLLGVTGAATAGDALRRFERRSSGWVSADSGHAVRELDVPLEQQAWGGTVAGVRAAAAEDDAADLDVVVCVVGEPTASGGCLVEAVAAVIVTRTIVLLTWPTRNYFPGCDV
eukprot:scaffold73941_cov76-Attheya_sp.AAC.1